MHPEKVTAGIFALTPSESKRLIAKAVARMPQVQWALEHGRIVIANGTTTAFVAEEILGKPVPKYNYAAGYIGRGLLTQTAPEERMRPYVLVKGQVVDISFREAIRQFEKGDVFIKGANAVDPQGHVGILMAHDRGGTIGLSLGTLTARGCHLIAPVGLEKMVPSVIEASRHCGQFRLQYALGDKVGLMPVVNAIVVTEIEALAMLTQVRAFHVASGGIGGDEGSVVLVVEGSQEQVEATFQLIKGIKGEPPVALP